MIQAAKAGSWREAWESSLGPMPLDWRTALLGRDMRFTMISDL